MIKDLVSLLDESSLACTLLMGVSIAAGIVFGLMAIAAGICALAVHPWWALGFVLSGLLSGAAIGLAVYIYDEYYWSGGLSHG